MWVDIKHPLVVGRRKSFNSKYLRQIGGRFFDVSRYHVRTYDKYPAIGGWQGMKELLACVVFIDRFPHHLLCYPKIIWVNRL